VEEGRLPSVDEIAQTSIPYLDAVQEEIFRKSLTSAFAIRTATVDTTILGHFVPKGTHVFLLVNGASFLEPSFDIPESRRSDSSRNTNTKIGEWDASDIGEFKPERWLVKEVGGQEVFNSAAGPQQLFGAGPRSCYGRRLAYMQLRFLVTMIVWSFELQYAGDKLSTYAGADKMTHQPKQCYVKLAALA
jgi:cytochrome P450